MSSVPVKDRVRGVIADYFDIEADEIPLEASFRDDLEADSLDLVELIMALEEEFGGEISDDEAQKIVTVGDAVAYIEGHLIGDGSGEPVSSGEKVPTK